jgi:hypothetical protein
MSKFSQESTDAVLQMMRWEVDSCFPLQLPPMSPAELEDLSRECGRQLSKGTWVQAWVLFYAALKENDHVCIHCIHEN